LLGKLIDVDTARELAMSGGSFNACVVGLLVVKPGEEIELFQDEDALHRGGSSILVRDLNVFRNLYRCVSPRVGGDFLYLLTVAVSEEFGTQSDGSVTIERAEWILTDRHDHQFFIWCNGNPASIPQGSTLDDFVSMPKIASNNEVLSLSGQLLYPDDGVYFVKGLLDDAVVEPILSFSDSIEKTLRLILVQIPISDIPISLDDILKPATLVGRCQLGPDGSTSFVPFHAYVLCDGVSIFFEIPERTGYSIPDLFETHLIGRGLLPSPE
jgi:hypothetical protein